MAKKLGLYFFNLGKGLDQFGGSIAGYGCDWTISATTGRNAYKIGNHWKFTQWLINETFYPVDGEDHCYRAWQDDKEESYIKGSWLVLMILTVPVCAFLAVIFWTIHLIRNIWKLFTN